MLVISLNLAYAAFTANFVIFQTNRFEQDYEAKRHNPLHRYNWRQSSFRPQDRLWPYKVTFWVNVADVIGSQNP